MADEKANNIQSPSYQPQGGNPNIPMAGVYPSNPNQIYYTNNPHHLHYTDPNVLPGYSVPVGTQQYPGAVGGSRILVASNAIPFGPDPVRCICAFCNHDVVTKTTLRNGCITWLSAGACCLFGLVLGCCLIPFCVKSLKDTVHTCPNCGSVLGVRER